MNLVANINSRRIINYLLKYLSLYLMLPIPVACVIVLRYIPMTYIRIAFKRYSFVQSTWEMPLANNHWFEYFLNAFRNLDFLYALRNTLLLNFLDLVIGFPAPIILALLLNE